MFINIHTHTASTSEIFSIETSHDKALLVVEGRDYLELTFSAISLSVCRDLGQGNFIFIFCKDLMDE